MDHTCLEVRNMPGPIALCPNCGYEDWRAEEDALIIVNPDLTIGIAVELHWCHNCRYVMLFNAPAPV